jgi:hypothetical protein
MKSKVKIAIDSRGGTFEVGGDIFGIVAVTPCHANGRRALVITHIETGRALGAGISVSDEVKAKTLAGLVNEHAAEFFGMRPGYTNKKHKALFLALWEQAGLGKYPSCPPRIGIDWLQQIIDATAQPVV